METQVIDHKVAGIQVPIWKNSLISYIITKVKTER